jgi:hypothetical protein
MWNSLCEVFVPIDEQGNGRNATGYPIAKDRVITCAHVLKDLVPGKTPEIRWPYLEPSGSYHPLADDCLKFDGREKDHQVDCAVLEVELPQGAAIAPLLPGCPQIGSPTHSMGFADVGKRIEQNKLKREQIAIDGCRTPQRRKCSPSV